NGAPRDAQGGQVMNAARSITAFALAGALLGCGSSSTPATITIPAAGGDGGSGGPVTSDDSGSIMQSSDDASTGLAGASMTEASAPADCRGGVAGVTVDERELQGFPPYAVDGCTLVYVSRTLEAGAHGDLHVRDLSSGQERVIATADEAPRRPTVSGGVI